MEKTRESTNSSKVDNKDMVIQTYVAFGQKVFGQILSSDFILN
jgi:hypothetical protein